MQGICWSRRCSLAQPGDAQSGRAFRFTSNWAEANEAYQEAATLSETAGDYANALYALGSRGEVLEAEGQLRQAAQQFEEVLRLARTWGIPNAAVTGYALVGLGRARYEWNELDAALHDVQTGLAQRATGGHDACIAARLSRTGAHSKSAR